jgi:hypothetical protein
MGFFSKLFGGGDKKPESYAGQTLAMQIFDGKDLHGADFSGAQLMSCFFRGCNLEGANFRGANLTACFFTNANLTHAILDEAECMGADFTGANMDGVSTFKTEFMGAMGVPQSAVSRLDDLMEDDQKFAVIRQKLELLAGVFPGGAVRERREDGEMFYAGQVAGRNFRVLQSVNGWLKVELKVRPGVRFSVFHDKEAKPTHGPGDADAVWGDSSATLNHFFGPGVYIQGQQKELEELKSLLTGDLPGMFGHFLAAANAERFDVYDDNVILELRDDLLSGDFAQRIRVAVDFVTKIATHFGQ